VSAISGAITLNAWHHVAATFDGTTMRLYCDGVLLQSLSTTVGIPTTTPWCNVGTIAGEGSAAYAYAGYIDEIRIIKGIARYTTNFTPPTAPFSSITGTTPPAITAIAQPSGITHIADEAMPEPGVRLISSGITALDQLDGGTHKITGTVAEKALPANTPLARRVMLIDERSHRVVRETWSDATGAYTFDNVAMQATYTVISYDHTATYRAVVADNLTPEAL
jgi:hypothetical protein